MASKWIKELPPGEYDIKKLKEFSGKSCHCSIKKTMKLHGAEIRKEPVERGGYLTDLTKNVFTWHGYKERKKSQ